MSSKRFIGITLCIVFASIFILYQTDNQAESMPWSQPSFGSGISAKMAYANVPSSVTINGNIARTARYTYNGSAAGVSNYQAISQQSVRGYSPFADANALHSGTFNGGSAPSNYGSISAGSGSSDTQTQSAAGVGLSMGLLASGRKNSSQSAATYTPAAANNIPTNTTKNFNKSNYYATAAAPFDEADTTENDEENLFESFDEMSSNFMLGIKIPGGNPIGDIAPVGDGVWFLLLLASGYVFFRKKERK